MGLINKIYKDVDTDLSYNNMTVGIVVDTNDPQQMGRIRVACPAWGESVEAEDNHASIPWAMYASPFAGVTSGITKGPNGESTDDLMAYGMWSIPKVGASVIVSCIDGDPRMRIWLACLYNQHTPHTMPHGRYVEDGPTAHNDTRIDPLHTNYQKAFDFSFDKPEAKTRALDYSVAAVDQGNLEAAEIDTPDAKGEIRQGYGESRIDPEREFPETTQKNYDSQVTSITTPGFHAFSMDDRPENCRVRMRTTSGHQISMDDTNERIYIMTAQGKNWIQIDQNGEIDIYSEKTVSVRAKEDINLSSDKTVRIQGTEGIHFKSDGEIRMESGGDLHTTVGGKLQVKTGSDSLITSGGGFHVSASGDVNLGGSNINLDGASASNISAGTGVNLKGGSMVSVTGSAIQLNGPPAQAADSPESASPEPAFVPSRNPSHEPWIRSTSKGNEEFAPEPDGKVERNDKWRP